MKTPFTSQQFLEVFKDYNETVFPTQIILYLLSFIALFLTIRPSSKSNYIISAFLAFFWLWMGIAYHLIFFTSINKAAYIFGAAFILQSILFLTYGILKNKLSFRFHSDIYGVTGIAMVLFALIIYPALGYFLGHVYPSAPTFGLPCPTTIFTFGMLLLSEKKCPVVILIIPFVWSIIGFTAIFNFGIWEDTSLLIAGISTLTMLLIRNKKHNHDSFTNQTFKLSK